MDGIMSVYNKMQRRDSPIVAKEGSINLHHTTTLIYTPPRGQFRRRFSPSCVFYLLEYYQIVRDKSFSYIIFFCLTIYLFQYYLLLFNNISCFNLKNNIIPFCRVGFHISRFLRSVDMCKYNNNR